MIYIYIHIYIYANIWGILMVNVTIYTIHGPGSYGLLNVPRIQNKIQPKAVNS